VAQEHLPLVRKNVAEILRVLARADKGRLHYTTVQHLVNTEVGHHVSGLHLPLNALANGGLVRKLPNKEGYEITREGREFHAALERILTISSRSNGNGGEGGH
jgi:predicted transcriptional regulator